MSRSIKFVLVVLNGLGMFINQGWMRDINCAWFVLVGAAWAFWGFRE